MGPEDVQAIVRATGLELFGRVRAGSSELCRFRSGEAIVGLFLLCALASVVVGWLGRNRKFGFWGYFFGSLALTPFIGLIILLASDPIAKEDGDSASGVSRSSS
jgi:hypothetical protein